MYNELKNRPNFDGTKDHVPREQERERHCSQGMCYHLVKEQEASICLRQGLRGQEKPKFSKRNNTRDFCMHTFAMTIA
jgi:hypothetical protein